MSQLRNDYSEKLREIWSDALGVTVTGDTDFFDVGGHSYMALDIIAKIDETYGCRLPLRSIFDNPRFDEFTSVIVDELATR